MYTPNTLNAASPAYMTGYHSVMGEEEEGGGHLALQPIYLASTVLECNLQKCLPACVCVCVHVCVWCVCTIMGESPNILLK